MTDTKHKPTPTQGKSIVAEAALIYEQTGLTPRQLAEQRAELLAALQAVTGPAFATKTPITDTVNKSNFGSLEERLFALLTLARNLELARYLAEENEAELEKQRNHLLVACEAAYRAAVETVPFGDLAEAEHIRKLLRTAIAKTQRGKQ